MVSANACIGVAFTSINIKLLALSFITLSGPTQVITLYLYPKPSIPSELASSVNSFYIIPGD